jgi:drug/metabolite transporter (DMT)-like permease
MPQARSFHRQLAWMNLATICFALVGVVRGKIDLPSGQAIWGRSMFAVIAVIIVLVARRQNPLQLRNRKDYLAMLIVGLFVSGNWYFFFEAIARSTVAIAVISLFTYPIITALLEPLIFDEPYHLPDLIGSIAVLIGVYLIVPAFDPHIPIVQGVIMGVLSALCFSLSNLMSRRLVRSYPSTTLMFYQFLVPAFVFLPTILSSHAKPISLSTLGYLILVGAILTTTAQLLFIRSLKQLSSSLASVLLSLQPFYTVLFAWLLLGQIPRKQTIWGGAIITLSVLLVSASHAAWPKKRAIIAPD